MTVDQSWIADLLQGPPGPTGATGPAGPPIPLVGEISTLQAKTGMTDGAYVCVPGIGSYVYYSTLSLTADGLWIIAPNSGTGRWVHEIYATLQVPNGVAQLDTSSKVPAANTHNVWTGRYLGSVPVAAIPKQTALSVIGTVTIAGLKVGDVLICDYTVLATANGAGSSGFTAAAFTSPASPNYVSAATVNSTVGNVSVATTATTVYLLANMTVTVAGTVDVVVFINTTNVTGGVNVNGGVIKVEVYRP